MVGATGEGTAGPPPEPSSTGSSFVLGFSLVFVAFWASIGLIGYVLARPPRTCASLGGALLVFLGLQVAGVINVRALWRDTRAMPALAAGS